MATYTYSGNPSSSARDEVRFLVGDTEAPWMLSDEEITYGLLRANNDVWMTASRLALAKAGVYSRRGNISIDGISLNYGDRGRALMELSMQLEKGGNKATSGPPVEGGGYDKTFDIGLVRADRDYPSVFDNLEYPT